MSSHKKEFITTSESLLTLKTKIDNNQIKLNDTQFQRNNVHTRDWQQQLILTLFEIGNILPPIYLARDEDGTENVIDGKQRLTAIYQFMNGVYGIKIDNSDEHEILYKDFDRKKKTLFDSSRLDLKTIDNLQPEDQIELFDRINKTCAISSGEKLNSLKILGGFYAKIENVLDNPEYEQEFNLLRNNISMGQKYKKEGNEKIMIDKYRFSVEEFVCQLVQYLCRYDETFDKNDFNNTYLFYKKQDLLFRKKKLSEHDKIQQILTLGKFNEFIETIVSVLKLLNENEETIKYPRSSKKKRVHIGKFAFLFPLCYIYHNSSCNEETKIDILETELVSFQNHFNNELNFMSNNKDSFDRFMSYLKKELFQYDDFTMIQDRYMGRQQISDDNETDNDDSDSDNNSDSDSE